MGVDLAGFRNIPGTSVTGENPLLVAKAMEKVWVQAGLAAAEHPMFENRS